MVKYYNGKLYPNAKMTVTTDGNPYAGSTTNKDYEVSIDYYNNVLSK